MSQLKKYKGKLIVLEGTDGSGKGTQLKLLQTRLKKLRHKISTMSFPQYGKRSAGLIEEYLNGAYGNNPDNVSPYAASLFYAVDRYDAARTINKWLAAGHIVLLDRYVDSNAGHQGGKITNPKERKKFIRWLYDIEYHIFGVPRPDMTIILDVPPVIGQRLVMQKNKRTYIKKGTHDIHEANLKHLNRTRKTYLWLAKTYPKEHRVLACVEDKRLLAPQDINDKIWKLIQKIL